ncbi:MAG TPA: hypothetical protein DCS93_03420 [Microscillaceae bacterium]|nr:hypothetical protein [Microscillaceae bacterium]
MKNIVITICITFFLSFLLQGINDHNVFIVSNWRQNNIANILQLWFIFLTTYYLFSFIVEIGSQKLIIDTPQKLRWLLVITQVITFLWVVLVDVLYYILYYKINYLSETTFYEFDIPLAIAILTIGSVYFYQKKHFKTINTDKPANGVEPPPQKSLEAFKGSKSVFISHADIGIIHLSDKIVWVTTTQNQTFQTNFSLAELTDELSSSDFFRVNRQVIISRKIVQGYDRLEYQKLVVLIDEQFLSGLNLVVSKYNAPHFKKWLTNSE